jgi:ataxin-3
MSRIEVQEVANVDYYLYFERQQAALCGVHAVNALLQGPYFTEVELAEFARQLDAQERALLRHETSGSAASSFLSFGVPLAPQPVANLSGTNATESGMFSLQVLAQALKVWDLDLIPLASSAAVYALSNLQAQNGFLCNLNEHWFAIRKVNGEWWNFNSLFPTPKFLGKMYLEAYLLTLLEEGYSLFLVEGNLGGPNPLQFELNQNNKNNWVSAAFAKQAGKSRKTERKSFHGLVKKLTSSVTKGWHVRNAATRITPVAMHEVRDYTDEDYEYEFALALSLSSMGEEHDFTLGVPHWAASDGGGDDAGNVTMNNDDTSLSGHKRDRPEVFDLLTGDVTCYDQEEGVAEGGSTEGGSTEGAERKGTRLQAIILPTLEPEPADSAVGTLEIGLKLPDGQRRVRKFAIDSTVGHVAAFAQSAGLDMQRNLLVSTMPRQVFLDYNESVIAAGLKDKDILFIERM